MTNEMSREVTSVKDVAIDNLRTENLQIRVEMQDECIEDYAAAYRERPEEMPPVVVFYDFMGDTYYLADGFHRVAAAKRAECTKIKAEVHEGTYKAALKYALGANAKHGLRRTNADKRNAMEIAWRNRATIFGAEKPTERQFAEICAVSNGTAHNFLADIGLLKLSKVVGGDSQAPRIQDSAEPTLDDKCGRPGTSAPTVLDVTHDHTEERNASVRDLLKQGKDRYGMEIPERILPAFLSREPRDIMKQLGELRKMVDDRHMHGDITYAHIGTELLMDLEAAIRTVRFGMAHCVCRMCRGRGCGACSDLGFQTRLQYGRVPPEYKAENQ